MASPKSLPQKATNAVLTETLQGLVEGLTGLAASSRKDLALSIGYVFQRLRGGEFLSALLREWEKYRKEGRVKDDYQNTEQHKVCLQELLDFLDKDSPDEIRFSVLKKIFLVAASEEESTRDSLLPQQYMRIARDLSDGEILVLNACYRAYKDTTEVSWKTESHPAAAAWVRRIAGLSGLEHAALVEIYEGSLTDKKLISPRVWGDQSGVALKPCYRLSSLGFGLCEFIAAYEGENAKRVGEKD